MRNTQQTEAHAFQTIAGHPVLDLANTISSRLGPDRRERLTSGADMLRWLNASGLVRPVAPTSALVGPQTLKRLKDLREAVFVIGQAIAKGVEPPARSLSILRAAANLALPEMTWFEGTLRWQITPGEVGADLDAVIACEALTLFCSTKATRIRLCEDAGCGWLFVDESRSGHRRWCSMSDCGANAKAKRHYYRAKASGTP